MAFSLDIAVGIAAILSISLLIYLYQKLTSGPVVLTPKKYLPIRLKEKKTVSGNDERPTVFLTFDTDVKDFPTGAHVSCMFNGTKGKVTRAYTPTRFSPEECELMIRVYPDGLMTQHMHKMKVGDTLMMKGPTGMKRYGRAGPGSFTKMLRTGEKHTKDLTHIVMFAGGTGITPFLQICNHIIADDSDNTKCTLLVANSTPNDVMMYKELEELVPRSKGKVKVEFTVSRKGDDEKWNHHIGRIDKAMIEKLCPKPGDDIFCALCGPCGFEKAVRTALLDIGYDKSKIWVW
mmetsp:Transcript_14901/g.22557  ORF Transcript_14901/g.22557 Transcript_14901/m.22557 type:complete len:290 (+) Transcript_14901:83-952(+)